MTQALQQGEWIEIRGFGSFTVRGHTVAVQAPHRHEVPADLELPLGCSACQRGCRCDWDRVCNDSKALSTRSISSRSTP
jgi:hypothetical protein